jgi:Ca2+-binding RTX toxin-like protein
MRKVMLLVGLMSLMVVMFAPMAMAVNKVCTTRPCDGTNNHDVLFERPGDGIGDTIYGHAGPDRIDASRYTADNDIIYGGRGNDTITTDDGDAQDTIFGGKGTDTCYVDSGDNAYGCEVLYVDGTRVT